MVLENTFIQIFIPALKSIFDTSMLIMIGFLTVSLLPFSWEEKLVAPLIAAPNGEMRK